MSNPYKVKTITHGRAIRTIEKAASEYNGTHEDIQKIAKLMREEGNADIAELDPPSLRLDLLHRFSSCSSERDGNVRLCCVARIFAWEDDYQRHTSEELDRREALEEETSALLAKACVDLETREKKVREALMAKELASMKAESSKRQQPDEIEVLTSKRAKRAKQLTLMN